MNVGGSVTTAAASVRDNYGEPQSVSGVGNSASGNLQSQLNMNLIVPMTPLGGGGIDSGTGKDASGAINVTLPASNIPAYIPNTPMTVSQPIDVPSPTLQNIVSTVNLGSSKPSRANVCTKAFYSRRSARLEANSTKSTQR